MIDFRQRERADMYTAWTYPKNVSKKADYLDISFFLPTEQVQELWIEKSAFLPGLTYFNTPISSSLWR
jgi:hypothetical protein